MNSNDIWGVITDFPNYEVSTSGNIRNRKTTRILKKQNSGKGYHAVSLCNDGVCVQKKVHRLVVETHIEPIPFGLVPNHIDGVKTNNTVRNLEIVTYSDNNKHAFNLGLKQPTRANKPVRCLDTGQNFESVKAAAEYLNVRPSVMSGAVLGKQKTVKGFRFEFVGVS